MKRHLLEDWQDEELISRVLTLWEREVAIRMAKRRARRATIGLGIATGALMVASIIALLWTVA